MRQMGARTTGAVFAFTMILAPSCWVGLLPFAHAEAPAAGIRSEAKAGATVDLASLYDAVVETIDRRFVNEELLKTLGWQGRARSLRPSVLSAATTEDAIRLINGLLAELKTSHTELFTPDDYRYYITLDALRGGGGTKDLLSEKFWGTGPYFPGTGAFTRKVDDRHFIDGVLEGSPADNAGLKFGDEILSVDGRPYSPIAAFRGKIGTTVELEVRRTRDAESRRYSVPVIPIIPSAAFSAATQASARVIEKNGRRIGYVHLWSVNEARSFTAALATLDPSYADTSSLASASGHHRKPLDSLIVDIRGRVGGNIGVAGWLLDRLGTAEKPYWGRRRSIDRSGTDNAAATDAVMSKIARPQLRPFKGRSAILIDHHTRSAGEVMAFGYKRSALGTTFGTQTAGAVSSGAPVVMPGGFVLYVAVGSHEFDGKRLEGVGVAPDFRVDRPLPYAAGADPVFDAAVDHLSKAEAP